MRHCLHTINSRQTAWGLMLKTLSYISLLRAEILLLIIGCAGKTTKFTLFYTVVLTFLSGQLLGLACSDSDRHQYEMTDVGHLQNRQILKTLCYLNHLYKVEERLLVFLQIYKMSTNICWHKFAPSRRKITLVLKQTISLGSWTSRDQSKRT